MNKTALILLIIYAVVITGCGAEKKEGVSSFKPEISKEINIDDITDPWGETQSLTVVAESSEVDFTPPPETALPEDVELTTYRYMEGKAEALYAQTENVLIIRKSSSAEGTALSQDENGYSKNWVEVIEDINVHCSGDGEKINSAYFDKENAHFSILYNAGKEGSGLTKDQLWELVLKTN